MGLFVYGFWEIIHIVWDGRGGGRQKRQCHSDRQQASVLAFLAVFRGVLLRADVTGLYSPSGLRQAFPVHPCTGITDGDGTQRKAQYLRNAVCPNDTASSAYLHFDMPFELLGSGGDLMGSMVILIGRDF